MREQSATAVANKAILPGTVISLPQLRVVAAVLVLTFEVREFLGFIGDVKAIASVISILWRRGDCIFVVVSVFKLANFAW